MKIGIDCRMMGKGFGLARYVEQLVLHLQKIDHENEYVLFVKEIGSKQQAAENFKEVQANIPWYGWEEQLKFKSIVQKENLDLMHFPHWNIPLMYNDPFVVTIHDLTMFHFPRPEATTLGPAKFWIKDKAHRLVLRHAVKQAKHIITTTDFTKNDVAENLKVDNKKMTTIYQAPFIVRKTETENRKQLVIDRYGLDKPFGLYVGAAYPHKNLDGLLKAWEVFTKRYDSNCELVLVGKPDSFYERLQPKISELKNVSYLGFVEDEALETLYKSAEFFVYPSLYEGFGLPPLEAMAKGLPVVSSNRSCLPEVLGEAALYADPESPDQLAAAMYQAFSDQNLRFELGQKAHEELKRYSWDSLAKETMAVYNNYSS